MDWLLSRLAAVAAAYSTAVAATPRSAIPTPLSGLDAGRRSLTGRCRRTTAVSGTQRPSSLRSSAFGMSGRRRRHSAACWAGGRCGGGGVGLAGSIGTKQAARADAGLTGDDDCRGRWTAVYTQTNTRRVFRPHRRLITSRHNCLSVEKKSAEVVSTTSLMWHWSVWLANSDTNMINSIAITYLLRLSGDDVIHVGQKTWQQYEMYQ